MRLDGRDLIAVGVNHNTAPVEVRERLAMPKELLGMHLKALIERGHARETVILSTCNRVEVYALVDQVEGGRAIHAYLSAAHGEGYSLGDHLYQHRGQEAVRHLFRVAASLDSLIVGEPQILGQLKSAYDVALENRAAGRVLNRVMRRAISVGKKVRTETTIGASKVSVGTAGVGLAKQVLGDLGGRHGLVVGAGELAELVAFSLKTQGVHDLVVVNRTAERAKALASKFGGRSVSFDAFEKELETVDVAVFSTASQQPILSREGIAPIMRRRRYRPLFLLDLSVPRNVSPDVQDVEGVYVFNIDDLEAVALKGREKRQEEAEVAETLVRTEAEKCYRSLDALNAAPLIGALTNRADDILAIERQRSHKLLADLTDQQRDAVVSMNRAVVKRLMHDPIRMARRLAEEGRTEELELLAEFFGLQIEELFTQEVE